MVEIRNTEEFDPPTGDVVRATGENSRRKSNEALNKHRPSCGKESLKTSRDKLSGVDWSLGFFDGSSRRFFERCLGDSSNHGAPSASGTRYRECTWTMILCYQRRSCLSLICSRKSAQENGNTRGCRCICHTPSDARNSADRVNHFSSAPEYNPSRVARLPAPSC